ncbi:MAG: DUF4271 domain-containing protein [Flavobacteriales bacterium]|nr:DUF4271 domain-containing protein [Flavobacteriales bacterium]
MPKDPFTLRFADPLAADWVALFLLLLVIVLAWVNRVSPRYWKLLGNSLLRLRLPRQTMREEVDPQDRSMVALLLVAVAVIGLFLFQGMQVFTGQPLPPLRLAGFVGGVLAVLVGQWMLVRLTGELFQVDGGLEEYLYTLLLLTMSLGLALLPLAVLFAYQPNWRPVLLIVGAGLLLLITLYRWSRGVLVGLGSGSSPGYIILYLCAAEALPAALAIRHLLHLSPTPVQPL